MLEQLDTILWADLTACNGSAAPVPALLRDLLSHDFTVYEHAYDLLFHTLYNQGEVCEATVHAIPFVIEVLEQVEAIRQVDLLFLLGHVARASYPETYIPELHAVERQQEEDAVRKRIQQARQRRDAWLQHVREEVSDGYHSYLHLLTLSDTSVRVSALHTLSCCQSHAPAIVTALQEHYSDEQDLVVKACILLCLGELMPPGTSSTTLFTTTLTQETEHLLKVAAAMVLAKRMREATPVEALDELLLVGEHPEFVQEEFRHVPWVVGDIMTTLSYIFRLMGLAIAPRVIPLLTRALAHVDGFYAMTFVSNLLYFTCAGKPVEKGISCDMLTQTQRMVLHALVESDQVWEIPSNINHILTRFGLPFGRDNVHAFLHPSGESGKTAG